MVILCTQETFNIASHQHLSDASEDSACVLPSRHSRYGGSGYGNGTFVCNHAQAIIACDFCVVVTATFRLLYVFVVMEHATRRVLHSNVTAHPTAPYHFLLHDHDSIFSPRLDRSIRNLGLRVVQTPPQSPQAHALCERLISTLR